MSIRTWSGTRLGLALLAWECVGLVIPLGVWASPVGRAWLAAHVIRGRPAWAYALLGLPLSWVYVALWLVLPCVVLVGWRRATRERSLAARHAAA